VSNDDWVVQYIRVFVCTFTCVGPNDFFAPPATRVFTSPRLGDHFGPETVRLGPRSGVKLFLCSVNPEEQTAGGVRGECFPRAAPTAPPTGTGLPGPGGF
jgi:hypothetical protein